MLSVSRVVGSRVAAGQATDKARKPFGRVARKRLECPAKPPDNKRGIWACHGVSPGAGMLLERLGGIGCVPALDRETFWQFWKECPGWLVPAKCMSRMTWGGSRTPRKSFGCVTGMSPDTRHMKRFKAVSRRSVYWVCTQGAARKTFLCKLCQNVIGFEPYIYKLVWKSAALVPEALSCKRTGAETVSIWLQLAIKSSKNDRSQKIPSNSTWHQKNRINL